MLPSGRFPRFALFTALLAALLLVYDLEFIHRIFVRLLLSNCLDAAVMFLAAISCFYVAFRSPGFARQVWFLLAIALAISACGQALSTYYQSFVPGASLSPEPSDIFFFVWAAPVFMILLPRSEEQSTRLDFLRLLDLLQIAIVAVTAYLYFFYFTALWNSDQLSLVRGILLVYIARDLLLALGFLFRSRSSAPSWFRRFAFILTFVFLAMVASHADYLVTLAAATGDASWGDLVAMLPFALIIALAAFWKDPEPAAIPAPSSRAESLFTTQFFPVVMPLLVIFMARAIAPEHALLAWLALGASVLCSSIRLIFTNRRQQRISDDLLNAEKAVLRSQQLFATAFRSSPDGFSINVFPDGPYLDVNDGFTRLTGYSREEAINTTPAQLNLWLDPTRRAEVLSNLTQVGEIREVEFEFRTKSGTIRTGQLSGTLLNLDGRQCAVVAVRDITDRKAAEELIRTSEERFRSLVDHLHVGIASYDPQARILFANQAALDLFGLALHQVVGKTTAELGFFSLREDGTQIPESSRVVPTVLATRQPLRSQLLGWQLPGRPGPIWTLLDAIPEFNSAGELFRVVVSFTDLTAQRRATEALRESEERFRSFVENLHVGIVSCNPLAQILYANPAALNMFGLTAGQVIGKTELDLHLQVLREDGSILPDSEGLVPTVVAARRPLHNLVIGWRHMFTRKVIWTLLDAVPQLNSAGDVTDILVSLTDLSEQRQAVDALRESEERFRTLVRDLHVGVVLQNPDATVQFANRAALEIFDLPLDQILGKDPLGIGMTAIDVNGRLVPFEKLPAPTVIRTKLPVRNQVLGWRRPGNSEVLWIFGNAVPQFAPDGSVFRVITSFADITEMKNAERSIHQLSTELLKLQDEERRRIGRELHDGMAQTVLAVNLSLAQLRQSAQPLSQTSTRALDKARELLQQMSREIRTLSYLLHPPLLDDLGLVTALKEYINGFSERSGIETSLDIQSRFRRLPQMAETALFRITQESLSNIQRHSGSKRAKVTLREEADSIALEIVDFGHGMPQPVNGATHRSPPRLGVGIPGMRERMAQLGGSLDIDSNPTGTTVRARILLSAPVLKEAFNESSAPSNRG